MKQEIQPCFNLVAFCAGRARHLFSSPFTLALCSTTSLPPPLLFSFPARLSPTPCPTAFPSCFDIQIDSNTLSDQAAEKARIEVTVMNPRRALEVSLCLPASPRPHRHVLRLRHRLPPLFSWAGEKDPLWGRQSPPSLRLLWCAMCAACTGGRDGSPAGGHTRVPGT